jgi:AcrR family transcriptional regulator
MARFAYFRRERSREGENPEIADSRTSPARNTGISCQFVKKKIRHTRSAALVCCGPADGYADPSVPSSVQHRQAAATVAGPKATRTREILVQAARILFLKHGYVDTSVDDIAEAAEVSRPTFYTYFRSKREILEAIGLTASNDATPVFDALGDLGPGWTTADVSEWVRSYFAYQRTHGPWSLVWHQAVMFDRHILESERSTRRYHARKIGKHLNALRGTSDADPVHDGLVVIALLEALWGESLRSPGSEAKVVASAARAIAALISSG